MISLVREWLATRAGRGQASREIELISRWGRSSKDVGAEPLERLNESGGRNPFARAYAGRWFDEGFKDAEAGRSRSLQFANLDYDWGWLEGMRKRHAQGFEHGSLAAEFTRISQSPAER